MVPSKRIAPEAAPETLPEDFSDWDGESSSAILPVESKKFEIREAAPPARERAPIPITMTPAPRVVEKPKAAAPAPIPTPTPTPSRTPAPTPTRKTAPGADSDLEAFLRRLSEVNADIAPARPLEPVQTTSHWPPIAPSQGNGTVRQEPMPATFKSAPVQQEPVQMFRTEYEESEELEAGERKKPRWVLIGGIAAGVVGIALVITIPVLSRGKSATLPPAAASPTKALGIDESSSALKPSPVGTTSAPAATSVNSPKPSSAATEQYSTSYNDPAPAPVSPDQMNQQLSAASQLPQGARKPAPVDAPPPTGFGVPGLDAASAPNSPGSTFKGGAKIRVAPLDVSAGVAGGNLIRKVRPIYPEIAKAARVSGTVVLAATITRDGFVTNLQVVSGPQMLRQAAIDAVRDWRYRPYLLNNQPMEVQTTIDVDFNL